MKKLLILLLLVTLSHLTIAQSIKTVQKENSITMFGVIYTHNTYIGSYGFNNPSAIEDLYFKKWNNMFLAEKDKYSIEKSLQIEQVNYYLEIAERENEKVTTNQIEEAISNTSRNRKHFSIENAKSKALSYNLKSDTRFGIIFFAVEYNKIDEKGTYYAVILDTQNKTVVYASEIQGMAKGFGFRNYWANTFHKALKDLRNDIRNIT